MIPRAVQKNNDSASDVIDSESFLERTAWMKLDRWIIPVITMFYLLSFLVRSFQQFLCRCEQIFHAQDRTNVGNARVTGLQKDLHMCA
jgi:hypothetical protein